MLILGRQQARRDSLPTAGRAPPCLHRNSRPLVVDPRWFPRPLAATTACCTTRASTPGPPPGIAPPSSMVCRRSLNAARAPPSLLVVSDLTPLSSLSVCPSLSPSDLSSLFPFFFLQAAERFLSRWGGGGARLGEGWSEREVWWPMGLLRRVLPMGRREA